MVRITDTR